VTIIIDRPVIKATTLADLPSGSPVKGRPATSLADLYRKAKKTGVLAAFSEYPQ